MNRLKSALLKLSPWRGRAIPLRTYLVAVIMVATVPIAALMSYRMVVDIRTQQSQTDELLRSTATSLAHAVERELASSVDALTILSHAAELQRGDVDAFAVQWLRINRLRPGWDSVFVLDAGGRVLYDSAGTGLDGGAQLAVALAAARMASGAESPALVTGLISNRLPGRHEIAIAVPVRVDGQLRQWLGAWIPAGIWGSLLASTGEPPDGGVIRLYDRTHRLIASHGDGAELVGLPLPEAEIGDMNGRAAGLYRHDAMRRISGDDRRYGMVAWNSVAGAGWGTSVSVAAEPNDGHQGHAVLAALATAAACLLLGTTLAMLVARRITGPLYQLATTGTSQPLPALPVEEVARLRDALQIARDQDEAARIRLQRKADEFETLFASTPIGLAFAQDPQCEHLTYNAAMAELFGPAPNSSSADASHWANGGGPVVYLDGEVLPVSEQPLQRAAAAGIAVAAVELEIRREGQPPTYVLAHAVPLSDADGQPRGAIGAAVDITGRKHSEERLLRIDERLRESQRLVDLAQQVGEVGFFLYRYADDTMTLTQGLAQLFGAPAYQERSTLDAWLQRVADEDRGRVRRALEQLQSAPHDAETLEFRVAPQAMEAPDVRWLSCRVVLQTQDDGTALQLIGVAVDVTASRRVQDERAALVLREQALRREAESANRAKDEFLAMLGHELRNPLSAIASAVEVLNRVDGSTELAEQARTIIARQTRHLARLMGDLLDVTRVIAGKIVLSRQPMNLAALVQRHVATLELTREIGDHVLTQSLDDAWVDADATRIEQVVSNLLTNAVKYTPSPGRIGLELRQEGDWVRLSVSDTGVGIPEELLPRVFDLFVQGERTLDRRVGGLGIGLTLVKRLVELHGGTVEVASTPQGTTFTLNLPAIAPPAQAVAVNTAQLPPAQRRRVLLVEDNNDVLEALHALLELDGHIIETATDGVSGLEALVQQRPDVAVVDIGLPGLTGYEVAKRSRAAGYPGRIIALSGYGQAQDVQKSLAAGFDAHLVKPVDAADLRRLLVE